METALPVLIGLLVAASVYLMLDGHLLRFVFGLVLLSNAANLTIFVAGGLTRLAPPLIVDGATAPATTVANALPQALVLTAIVIGFGLFAFALALIYRSYRDRGTLDSDALRHAEDTTPGAITANDATPAREREKAA